MSRLKIIDNPGELDELIQHCKTTKYASFDFETSGTEYYEPNHFPTIMAVSFQIGSAWVLPLAHKDSKFKDCYKPMLRKFSLEVLENPNIVKLAWNMKFEHKWCIQYGMNLRGRLFDVMLMKYCLEEDRPNDLKSWVQKIFPEYGHYEDEVKKLVNKHGWADVPIEQLAKYNAIDADLTLRLGCYFEKKLIRGGFYTLFRNLLMMGHRVLTESEYEGLTVDRKYLKGLVKDYAKRITKLDKKLRNNKFIIKYNKILLDQHKTKLLETVKEEIDNLLSLGKEPGDRVIRSREEKISKYLNGEFSTKKELFEGINFNSPVQMADLFFNNPKGYQFKATKYTDSGKPSTDEEVLMSLAPKDKTGFIKNLLDNRGLTKLYSTYIKGMYDKLGSDNKIHGSFLLHGTVTGRLSSREPNLQNIPRDTTSADIKKMFIPPPGYLLLEVDYSQAELRVVAEVANETAMIDIFRRDYNIHVATACKANGMLDQYEEVRKILKNPEHPDWLFWEKQKKRAKLLNFGILYGQTEKKLSVELECSEAEAKQFIEEWFEAFPRVRHWIKKQHRLAKQDGYVRNLFGRKRRLHDIYSDQYGRFLEAQRQSVNAPIQGTASDFTLFSTIIIREEKELGNLPYDMPQVYTVHDSIGYYIKPELIHKVVPKIIAICANPQTYKWFGFQMKKVNMKVSPEVGKTWGGLEDYNPTTNYTTWVEGNTILL